MLLSEQDISLMCWAGPRPSTREEWGDGGEWEEEKRGEENGTETEITQWQILYWVYSDTGVWKMNLLEMSMLWSERIMSGQCGCFSSLPLWVSSGWSDNSAQLHPQLCVGPQQNLLFISLIGHIWRHYLHLGVVQRGRGFRERSEAVLTNRGGQGL